jgi:soluble lytic murein transglycosylase-like protein
VGLRLIAFVTLACSAGAQTHSDRDWRELWERMTRREPIDYLLPRAPARQADRTERPLRARAVPVTQVATVATVAPRPSQRPNTLNHDPEELVRQAACELGVPPGLALALIRQESGFRNNVVGPAGEIGAAQILPSTGRNYGFDLDRLRADYTYNVRAGLSLLRSLLDQFGDEASTLKAYNGGPNWAASSSSIQAAMEGYSSSVLQKRRLYATVQCGD